MNSPRLEPKYLYGLLLLGFVSLMGVAFSHSTSEGYELSRREILLRRVGHELLLQSGDSTSRVLAVKKINDNEYQVGFEKEMTFRVDSLVATVRRLLARDPLSSGYVVNVLNARDASVTYGFAVAANRQNDIMSCSGRKQPVADYIIDVKFEPATNKTLYGFYFAGLPAMALAGLLLWRASRRRNALPAVAPATLPDDKSDIFTEDQLATDKSVSAAPTPAIVNDNIHVLGKTIFDVKARTLEIDGVANDLTATETRVLRIFATSPNITIERSRLQKEIWEDEGVIVGRSLDMFISKLRKKLEADASTHIVVVRGKGYRLEIGG